MCRCSLVVELQPSKLVVWVRFPSPAPKKTDTRMGIGLLFVCIMGIEPERVAALNKQSSGLFVAGESLSGSESQLALAFGKSGDSHHHLQLYFHKSFIVEGIYLW